MSDSTLFLILSSWLLLFTSTGCKTIYYWSYDPISAEKLGELTNGRSWSLTGKDFGRQGGALETDSKVKWDPSASESHVTARSSAGA